MRPGEEPSVHWPEDPDDVSYGEGYQQGYDDALHALRSGAVPVPRAQRAMIGLRVAALSTAALALVTSLAC